MKKLIMVIAMAIGLSVGVVVPDATPVQALPGNCYKVGSGSTIGSYCPTDQRFFYHRMSGYCPSFAINPRRYSSWKPEGQISWLPTCPGGYWWTSYYIQTI